MTFIYHFILSIHFPQGVDEIGHHAKLGSSFVKAYSDTMLGQLEGFFKVIVLVQLYFKGP